MTADIVIKGGTVVDGTGAPGVRADVAVTDGRISAIGPDLEGARTLDADGHVVAPGFIDIHTHYDAQVFWDPALTPSCFHGVTTVVAGNCGFSIAPTRAEHRELIARTLENVEDMDVATLAAGIPWDFATFPEYLASVERRGTGLNFGAYIGHTALRLFVMGDDAYERTATDDERAGMQRVLKEALDAGAVGFATSFAPTHRGVDGKPIPSRFADRAELEAILDTVREVGRGVVEITPGELCGIDDIYDFQLSTGVPFTYTALMTSPAGTHKRLVDVNEAGWERGAQVWPQVTPRPLVFSMSIAEPFTLNPNAEFAALMSGSLDDRRRAYADPAWRDRVRTVWRDNPGFSVPRWDTYEVAETEAHPELIGRRLLDVADERGTDAFDTLLDLTLDEPALALRVRCVLANDDTSEVGALLSLQHATLGLSDAGAHVGQLCDAPQATDFLGNWVRDRGLMPIEQAVRKLTSVQAGILGLADRGTLRPGAWADVVVFDPETVAPGPTRRVRDFPADAERLTADQPTGIRHVLVNGTPIQVDGVHDVDARPGHVVRPAAELTVGAPERRGGSVAAEPDPAESRRRYDRMAGDYDRHLGQRAGRMARYVEGARKRAVSALALQPGQTVLDVGCGTGSSFGRLTAAVSPGGRVVGVDQSAGMLEVAAQRIAEHGWSNVDLVTAPVDSATLPPADAALLFFTHDLMRTPGAHDAVLAALHEGGRVAAAGLRRPSLWLGPVALGIQFAMRRYTTTRDGIACPWDLLGPRLEDLTVQTSLLGSMYVLVGTRPSTA